MQKVSEALDYALQAPACVGPADEIAVALTHAALLDIPAEAYVKWSDAVSKGFAGAARFLHGRGLFWWKDVPYPSQITALAALLAVRGNRPLHAGAAKMLERWFWCGVFGELYGSSTDTRVANDVEELRRWLDGGEVEPRTINGASFSESRLDTLYVRLSAAYKGVRALIMNSGACDFLGGEKIGVAIFFSESFDIHHIFPRAWCDTQKIPRERYNTIVNKSAILVTTSSEASEDMFADVLLLIRAGPEIADRASACGIEIR